MPRSLGSVRLLVSGSVAALVAAVLPLAVSAGSTGASGAPAAVGHGSFKRLAGITPGPGRPTVRPEHFTALSVDTGAIRSALAGTPRAGADSSTVFEVPTPDGGTERFAVQRTQLMEAGLAAAHPEISTWAGHSLDDPGTTIAMDVTPMGFHASVRSGGGSGTWYVDPAYDERGATQHLSYYGAAAREPAVRMAERELPAVQAAMRERAQGATAAPQADLTVQQRTYRLALLNDPSYARYFGPGNVLAAKVTLMNRVNQIYNDDLAINLKLIDGTDTALDLDTRHKAIGANGPCGAHACYDRSQLAFCDVPTLVRNQIVLGQLVGAASYDIGHIMLGKNGGGIAGLGVVGSIEKAEGCTGLPDPTGDFMAIDYVAHEMGHQFGGNHTFNGVQYNCSGGNRAATASVEPGSGSSVMAYAGICLQDDLQPHSDPYFSQRTLDEVGAYTTSTPRGPVESQNVSLRGFDRRDRITLDYPGALTGPITLTRGRDYTRRGVERAVERLTGLDVTVVQWGYDPFAGSRFPAAPGAIDDTGFQVVFAPTTNPYARGVARVDRPELEVTSPSAGVRAHVGETAKGGDQGNQGVVGLTGNHAPVVTAPAARMLPVRTPFTLTGSATDADGDPLTYLWEQDDRGARRGTALVSNAKVHGPLFRVFGTDAQVTDRGTLRYHSPGENHATDDPTRTFPDLGQVLAGNTNAATGTCPKVAPLPSDLSDYKPVPAKARNCYSEFLPTGQYVGRPGSTRPAMHFRLTARDGRAGGGGVGHADVTLRIDRSAGPFLVTSFAKGGTASQGRRTAVTWKVNGTRELADRVSVLLSTNGGKRWRTLVASTPNDGSVRVRFPAASRHARLMVRAVDNYFFDTNDHEFTIR